MTPCSVWSSPTPSSARTPTCPRAGWPSCAPPSSTRAPSPRWRARIGLGEHIKLGRGEETTGGRDKSSILSDTVEAVIGAVYLSGGFEGASEVVHLPVRPADGGRRAARRRPGLEDQPPGAVGRALGLGVPEYVIEDEGPDHEKTFTAQVRVGDELYGHGTGRSKKEAEQQAAETAYRAIADKHGDLDRHADRRVAHPALPADGTRRARAPRGRGRAARPRVPRGRAAPSPTSTCSTRGRYAGTRPAPQTSPRWSPVGAYSAPAAAASTCGSRSTAATRCSATSA